MAKLKKEYIKKFGSIKFVTGISSREWLINILKKSIETGVPYIEDDEFDEDDLKVDL